MSMKAKRKKYIYEFNKKKKGFAAPPSRIKKKLTK